MPIRFTSPSLGGHEETFLKANEWEFGIFYRRLTADDWFVGEEIREDLAPGGQPVNFNINSLDLTATYGVTDRFSLRLTLPFSTGRQTRVYADSNRHTASATGLGDINLLGNFWMLNPVTHPGGNFALGLGVKAPTGSNDVRGDFFTASGSVEHPVDQAIQLGDGGWGIIVAAQGFRRLFKNGFGYLSGSYQFSPRETTDVVLAPGSTVIWSVPDVYQGRIGLAYALWPRAGLSVSLGGRIDGMPVRDAIGGDEGFRRPGYSTFLDPGLAIRQGKGTFTLSVPIRLHGEFKPNVQDQRTGAARGGDLASYLIFMGYTLRP